ncbi:MAG: hypothetical protein C0412_13575 [Flavobacterium sp.]|nr:hypothetical protein [Flavobacterium sp.]
MVLFLTRAVLIAFYIVLLNINLCSQPSDSWGLVFNGSRQPAKNTSLFLSANELVETKSVFLLSFDLELRTPLKYGTIVSGYDKKQNFSFWILFYHFTHTDTAYLNFHINSTEVVANIPILKKDIQSGRWRNFQVVFNSENQTARLVIDSVNQFSFNAKIPSEFNLDLFFGQRANEVESPAMAVRDIKISSELNKPLYRWKLNEQEGSEAHE